MKKTNYDFLMEKQIFKVEDKVFVYGFGWGKIVHLKSKTACITFTDDHYDCRKIYYEFISFTEYTLNDFSQKRIINYEDYIGKWGKFFSDYSDDIVLSKLKRYMPNGLCCFETIDEQGYSYFEPLSEEQIQILNLE